MRAPLVPTTIERSTDSNNSAEEPDLGSLGIERVKTEAFIWGGYRYSTARDAIAAARRAKAR